MGWDIFDGKFIAENISRHLYFYGYVNTNNFRHGFGMIEENKKIRLCVYNNSKIICEFPMLGHQLLKVETKNHQSIVYSCVLIGTAVLDGLVFINSDEKRSIRIFKNGIEQRKLLDFIIKSNTLIIFHHNQQKREDEQSRLMPMLDIIYSNGDHYHGIGSLLGIPNGKGVLTEAKGTWTSGIFYNGYVSCYLKYSDNAKNQFCFSQKISNDYYYGYIDFSDGDKWTGHVSNFKMDGEGLYYNHITKLEEQRSYIAGVLTSIPYFYELLRRVARIEENGLSPEFVKNISKQSVIFKSTFTCRFAYYLANLIDYATIWRYCEDICYQSFEFCYYRLFCKFRSYSSQVVKADYMFECYEVDF